MKGKVRSIVALLAILMLVVTLTPLANTELAMAKSSPGKWVGVPAPDPVALVGCCIADMAIASDGNTIYAIDGSEALDASGATGIAIYKSMDGGYTWIGLPAVPGATAGIPPGNVAVAPDNPCVVAVSEFDAASGQPDQVHISTDGGFTWTTLPALVNAGLTANNQRILDLKVGPTRPSAIYGRDYLVATCDDTATVAEGSIQILGEAATWTIVSNSGVLGGIDFVACEFSPGFAGDRIVFGVGNTGAATNFYTYNVQNYSTVVPVLIHAAVNLDGAATDFDLGVGANSVVIGDIAVPSDYDITPGYERVYASIATTATISNGIWRCDGVLAPVELGFVATPINSIAYSGTVAAGKLIAGEYHAAKVWYSTTAMTSAPIWDFSSLPPPGLIKTVVGMHPEHAVNHICYAGTCGPGDGGFYISTDNAHTFDSISEELFVYSIKFLCGNGSEEFGVKPANYATAINIHNVHDEAVTLKKKVVVAHREGEPVGEISPYAELSLDPGTAVEVDCADICNLLGIPFPPPTFIKGFVTIESPQPLNIVAVYTAKSSWWCWSGMSIDVEQISPVVSP
jgi:hypothetical protein